MKPSVRALIDLAPPRRLGRQGNKMIHISSPLPLASAGVRMTPPGFTHRMTPMARGIAFGMCVGLSCAQIGKILGQPLPVVQKTRRQLLRAVGITYDKQNIQFAVRANAAIREEWNFGDSRNGSLH